MKRFVRTIFLMLGIIVAVSVIFDAYVTYRLQNSRQRKYVMWNDIIQRQIDADLLIMGNSRAWVQYDPAIIDSIMGGNCYNLGINGSPLNRQIVKYNIYRHYQYKPKCIVVNIDCFTLTWRDGYEREQFFPYLMYPYVRNEIRKVEPFSIGELYIPLCRYLTYSGIYSLLKECQADDELYKGYRGGDWAWDPTTYNKIVHYHFTVNDSTVEMFDRFLMERKTDGIKILFCHAPIYAGFTQKVDNLQEMYDMYQTIADKYNIPILDYSYDAICGDTTYFYNAMHLNQKGAEKFSRKLALDLDSMGIMRE